MSLLPIVHELLDEFDQPLSLYDQNFGLGMMADDLFVPSFATMPLRSGYLRPWRHQPHRRSGQSNLRSKKEGFEINLDVQQFKPDEVSVKVVDDYVVVEGKHEERPDEHGFISRQFTRRYKLPSNVEPEAVTSKLSSDGVLTVVAPKKALPPANPKERSVPIVHTNKPAVTEVAQQANGDKQEQMES